MAQYLTHWPCSVNLVLTLRALGCTGMCGLSWRGLEPRGHQHARRESGQHHIYPVKGVEVELDEIEAACKLHRSIPESVQHYLTCQGPSSRTQNP